MSVVQQKHCTKCGNDLPATTEFFPADKHHRDGFHSWCRKCKRKDTQERGKRRSHNDASEDYKRCIRCEKEFPATREFFYSSKKQNTGLHSYCKTCHSEVNNKKKQSGDYKTGTPDLCGSCGAENGNILGDINNTTHERYGYLCARCYELVRKFHGDAARMRNVLAYIERTRYSHV